MKRPPTTDVITGDATIEADAARGAEITFSSAMMQTMPFSQQPGESLQQKLSRFSFATNPCYDSQK